MNRMKELYQKVAEDSRLQKRFFEILDETGNLTAADTAGKLTAFAADAGFKVGIGEIQDFFKTLIEGSQEQLSEMELDMVAGGKGGGIDWGKITAGAIIVGSIAGGAAGGGPAAGVGCTVGAGIVEGATR